MSGKVSVIIPTYNQVNFVDDTIKSVLSQTYSNIEIIITDDGSVDGTQEILKRYRERFPDKIKLILSSCNKGIAHNMNNGLEFAKGEFIAWLGGDDLMFPQKIEKQVNALSQKKDALICVHDAEVFESSSGKILGIFSELYNGKREVREGGVELLFSRKYFMLPSAIMFRSKALKRNELDRKLRFDERLKLNNDWLFDIELFNKGKCIALNEIYTRYRRHSNNITSSSLAQKIWLEEGLMVLGIVESRYPELSRFVYNKRKRMLIAKAIKCYKNNDNKGFKNYIKAAVFNGALISGVLVFIGFSIFGRILMKRI